MALGRQPCPEVPATNPSVISRNAAPRVTDRDGRLSTQLDHAAIRWWHATITAKPPYNGLGVDMPTIDLGRIRSRKAAQVAANLLLKHWTWNITGLT